MRQAKVRRDDTGAATLEFTGVTAAAVVVVLSILLVVATAAPGVGDRFRRALCQVTTLGQGSCGTPTSAADHRPRQPCVISTRTRSVETEVAVAVVTLGDGRRFEVSPIKMRDLKVGQPPCLHALHDLLEQPVEPPGGGHLRGPTTSAVAPPRRRDPEAYPGTFPGPSRYGSSPAWLGGQGRCGAADRPYAPARPGRRRHALAEPSSPLGWFW